MRRAFSSFDTYLAPENGWVYSLDRMSDVTGDSVAYKSLFAIGLTLFFMTLIMNTVSQYFKTRFREVYT